MSQYLLPTIDPSVNTGSQLSVWLNLWAQAVQTQQMGASRPVDAQAGMIWIKDVSPVLQQLMVFDGADDLELLNWNPSTNVVSYPGAVKGPASSDIYNLASWGGDNGDTLLDTGFEIQSSVTDTVGNKVMRLGAFGLGGESITVTDMNDAIKNGFYRLTAPYTNSPDGASAVEFVVTSWLANVTQRATRSGSPDGVCYVRSYNGNVSSWGAWKTEWDTGNLVKQTSSYDTAVGAMLAIGAQGAFGLGGNSAIYKADINTLTSTGFYTMNPSTTGKPSFASYAAILHVAYDIPSSYWVQVVLGTSPAVVGYRSCVNGVIGAWQQFAMTAGSAFTGETQFESIKASGTIKSAGGQVSAADMEAFTAVQVNEAGQPLPPTFLADLENQITAMQAQITALTAQVEALTP